MKRFIVLLALLLGGVFGGILAPSMGPAAAADLAPWHYGPQSAALTLPRGKALLFPRGARAQAVWAEQACWNDCQSTCNAGLATCLQFDAQGRCLKFTDACDRSCQRACRTEGGPLLELVE
jgi:hypothetical protein